MGPWARRVLHTYWDRIQMVACAGGCYGAALQGFQGVNQGDPLHPTILNLVVDAVVRHWILLVVGVVVRKDGWGR